MIGLSCRVTPLCVFSISIIRVNLKKYIRAYRNHIIQLKKIGKIIFEFTILKKKKHYLAIQKQRSIVFYFRS